MHPLASIADTKNVVVVSNVICCVVLLSNSGLFHTNVYGNVPPLAEA